MITDREIARNIHLVGGPAISHSADCLVYVIAEYNGQAALIDSGAGPGFPRIQEELVKVGALAVERLLTTHAHIDHIGAHAIAKKAYNCIITAHETAIPILETGDRIRSAADLYGLPLEPCKVDEPLKGKSGQINFGELTIQWLHVPGHTPDSVVFYIDDPEAGRILFAQDAHGPLDPRWGSDRSLFKESLLKLINLDADILCEGHFGIYSTRTEARDYLEEQYDKF